MRLIDAEEVVKAVDKHTFDTKDGLCLDDDISVILEDVPTIEERKAGEWIVYKAPDKYHCGLCKCPFCGEEMIAESDEYNFCPNCGADMRGEQDEHNH